MKEAVLCSNNRKAQVRTESVESLVVAEILEDDPRKLTWCLHRNRGPATRRRKQGMHVKTPSKDMVVINC
jgi:hypothetical protein